MKPPPQIQPIVLPPPSSKAFGRKLARLLATARASLKTFTKQKPRK